jgi:hypothetical protein
MSTLPRFPFFKGIAIEDRDILSRALQQYQPETSEWTFTNLFIWRSHYGLAWTLLDDCIVILAEHERPSVYAMQPIGRASRGRVGLTLLEWLKKERQIVSPCIERADKRFVAELSGIPGLFIEQTRDHFDYVYLRDDLAHLGGNKYRSKRNHINKVQRTYTFSYEPLEKRHLEACLLLQLKWCQARRCEEDLNLLGEWEAIREILANFPALDLQGGVVIIDGNVEAFTLGELLNDQTAVIHIEKANPEIAELYTVVNQQCAEKCWGNIRYINREQDLGIPGLREAKTSYHPHHMEEKYRITLTG